MRGNRRISVRLNNESRDFFQQLAAETGRDLSSIVRKALTAYKAQIRGADAADAADAPKRRLTPPDAVFEQMPQYSGWAKGDLRIEAARLFTQTLAASLACRKFYPKTPGIVERYEALLQLCDYFGLK